MAAARFRSRLSARRDPGETRPRTPRTSRPESSARGARADENTGDFVKLISYLPAAVTTLFVLAAGLLLGWIQ
ncbi:MAG TPA: hypothetical protein VMF52_18360 [Steroidobacteraceae bacterium]|nr:hypothetical protein [Steroidobacteraceae bacterium]